MNGCVISTSSITYAIKGRDLLRRNGMKAEIIKNGSSKGCGYSVRVTGNCEKAREIFEFNGIKITGIK